MTMRVAKRKKIPQQVTQIPAAVHLNYLKYLSSLPFRTGVFKMRHVLGDLMCTLSKVNGN